MTIGRRGKHELSPLTGHLDDQTRAWLAAALEPLSAPQNSAPERHERIPA